MEQPAGTSIEPPLANVADQAKRLTHRLQFCFALLTCLCGSLLSFGDQTESLPAIAIFCAVFGFLFVDRLELFALPPIAAYAAMALAAMYCVSDFADVRSEGNLQMVAVARLLVLVQAILMMQRKNRRIFEQLGVFCLLQLVVSAAFSNEISYGYLLLPTGILGIWSLTLLASISTWEGMRPAEALQPGISRPIDARSKDSGITISAADSLQSLTSTARRLPRVSFLVLTPAILMVCSFFFYLLPRTTDAAKMPQSSRTMVGFSDRLMLKQIGQMLQSSEPALRIQLTDARTRKPYKVLDGLYLRGCVLERYLPTSVQGQPSATWLVAGMDLGTHSPKLPTEFFPARSSDRNFFDTVDVRITCESMHNESLFSIAPYHHRRQLPGIQHHPDRWILKREQSDNFFYPRITYSFSSNGFRSESQTHLIARTESPEFWARYGRDSFRTRKGYAKSLLRYDVDVIPSAERLAQQQIDQIHDTHPSDYQIAKDLEAYLAYGRNFQYTLNLSFDPIPGMDPIEQFLSVDRQGHCQYFASALVMMLRSQGIPARMVAGYHTDEYNDLGQYYVARQLHAHAWVEALIARDQLPQRELVYGQPETDEYWLRLDPTPGTFTPESAGGADQLMNLTQKMWEDYVVDMDAQRQDETLGSTPGMLSMSQSYARFVDSVTIRLARLRDGNQAGGEISLQDRFSVLAALVGAFAVLIFFLALKLRLPAWIHRKIISNNRLETPRPTVDFYARALDQLARIGIIRSPSQTAREMQSLAIGNLKTQGDSSIHHAIDVLTQHYHETRYRREDRYVAAHDSADEEAEPIVTALQELESGIDRCLNRNPSVGANS